MIAINAIDKFRLRCNMADGTIQSYRIDEARMALEHSFSDDPSFKKSVYIVDSEKNISARLNGFVKEGFLSPKMKIQATLANEFDQGDLIFFDNHYWLCTAKENFHNIYFRGEVVQCNYKLRFQTKDSYEIHEFYVVAERPYSRNISTGVVIQTSSKEYRIRMQLNDITKQIFLQQRFIMGMGYRDDGEFLPDVYEVGSRDGITNAFMMEDGFLVLNLEASEYNSERDDIDMMIADYRRPPSPLPETPKTCEIRSYNENYDISIGDGIGLNVEAILTDSSGIAVDDVSGYTFNWSVLCNATQTKYVKISNNENKCNILCEKPSKPMQLEELKLSKFNLSCDVIDNSDSSSYASHSIELRLTGLI